MAFLLRQFEHKQLVQLVPDVLLMDERTCIWFCGNLALANRRPQLGAKSVLLNVEYIQRGAKAEH